MPTFVQQVRAFLALMLLVACRAGELGSIGGTTHLHGFTCATAVLRAAAPNSSNNSSSSTGESAGGSSSNAGGDSDGSKSNAD
jgi:hypothetical protein